MDYIIIPRKGNPTFILERRDSVSEAPVRVFLISLFFPEFYRPDLYLLLVFLLVDSVG